MINIKVIWGLLLINSYAMAGSSDLLLGRELFREKDYNGAALEFRREGHLIDDTVSQAGLFTAAGYAYLHAGDYNRGEQMLDKAEELAPERLGTVMLLRGESARLRRDWGNAVYYFNAAQRVQADALGADLKFYAKRHEITARLRNGDVAAAISAAERLPDKAADDVVSVLHAYNSGHDKRPWLGGVLGLIPGLGYLYSGEPANALRSLLLNGLFIYAMVDTAENEQWGAFSAVTFFEITWYSGSIYGGIDAAHRYNRRRLESAAETISGEGRLRLDEVALPLVTFSVEF